MRKILWLLLVASAFGQARYDSVSETIGSNGQRVVIPYATVNICSFPANAVPCTNLATTYTTSSLSVACASNAQLTNPTDYTCTGTSSVTGQFGAWLQGGNCYAYTLTWNGQSYGPYNFCPTGSATNLSSPPPIGNVVPNTIAATTFTASSVNTVVNPITNPATDIGAQISAVLGSDVHVLIPSRAAGYTMSTPVANTYSGIMIECADPGTVINWTGSSGSVVKTDGTQRVRFKGCTFNTTVAANTSVCLQVGGSGYTANTDIEDWHCGVEDSNAHFAKGFWVTGNDTTGPSGNTRITNSHARNFTSVGLQIDHAVDTYLTNVDNYAVSGNPTNAWGMIVGTGASGVYISNVSNGSSGTKIVNDNPTTNAFGKPPNYIWAWNLINDACYNSACLLFDASLSTPSGPSSHFYGYKYDFEGGWDSGCQLANCSGVVIQGGIDIKLHGKFERANQCHGILLDYPLDTAHGNVVIENVSFNDNNIQAGNCDDVHVTSGTSRFQLLGGWYWGSNLGDCCSVTKYGVNIETGASDYFTIANIDSSYHATGSINDGSTGSHKTLENIRTQGTADVTFQNRVTLRQSTTYLDNCSAGIPCYVPAPNSSIQFDTAANGGLGQWNIRTNSALGLFVTPTSTGTANPFAANGGITIAGTQVADNAAHLDAGRVSAVTAVVPAAALAAGGSNGDVLTKGSPDTWVTPVTTMTINGTTCTLGLSCTPAPTISATPTANHATCWKTSTQIGYCSTVVAADGTCTCN